MKKIFIPAIAAALLFVLVSCKESPSAKSEQYVRPAAEAQIKTPESLPAGEKEEAAPQKEEKLALTAAEKNAKKEPAPPAKKEEKAKENPAPQAKKEENTAVEKNTQTAPDEKTYSCVLSVRCDTISKNPEKIKSEKAALLPPNGIIYPECEVEFSEGESVFDVLLRELRRKNIHLEFEKTPVYDSAYIEGIANIYEFDCGELSGWMYKVNGEFPQCGCSAYTLSSGDRVEWVYTCDLGKDVGNG